MSTRSLVIASLVGTLLQVAMVVAGHSSPSIKGLFAVGGMGLSLVAGVLYARLARSATKGSASLGGLAAGAICAFLGIFVSWRLGDVPASLLALGTVSSAVTGAVGGLLGALSLGRTAAAAGVALLFAASVSNDARAQAASPVVVATELRGDSSATLRDFAWLTGRWEGTVANLAGAVLEVTYSAPRAGLMTGMMRLVQRDTVLVVELISMVETPRGVEMRFRHFSPTLDAYEREFKQTMRLTSHAPQTDVFENAVAFDAKLMSTQPRRTSLVRHGDDEFVGRSDIIGSDGKPAEIVSTYRRVR
jgi:Domain of unknown function (DUF6265)